MPWLASPAIASPAATLTVSGRNSGIATTRAVMPDEEPVLGDLVEERRAASARRRPRDPERDADEHRDERERAEHRPRAPPPEQRGELRSEQRQGAAGRAPPRVTGRAVAAASLDNVEPLPRQLDEPLLQARPLHLEAAHPHAGLDERGHDRLGATAAAPSRAATSASPAASAPLDLRSVELRARAASTARAGPGRACARARGPRPRRGTRRACPAPPGARRS